MVELVDRGQTERLVLLDCDGVLVENTAFERRVTKTLVEELASTRKVSTAAAAALWSEDLTSTKRDWRWYDYGYHCERLGLDPTAAVSRAHQSASHLLSEVEGVQETLDMLRTSGCRIGVATDATRWVVEYKLAQLGLDIDGPLLTSDGLKATKARKLYWSSAAAAYPSPALSLLVDNRSENLESARQTLGLETVQFVRHEHVTTLSRKLAPIDRNVGRDKHRTALNHEQLRSVLKEILTYFRMAA